MILLIIFKIAMAQGLGTTNRIRHVHDQLYVTVFVHDCLPIIFLQPSIEKRQLQQNQLW